DTITWLRIPTTIIEPPSSAGGAPTIRIPTALAWRDAWAVDREGRVAIARGDDYRVEWFDGGRRVAVASVSATRIPLTAADRRAVAAQSVSVSITAAVGQPRIIPDTASLSAFKPFFVQDGARVDAQGQ